MKRPFGVTLLAILAGILAVLAALRCLQFLGIIPFFITHWEIPVRTVSFWYALLWGLMVWVYAWLVKMLWEVNPAAWLFLAVITIFNLTMDFILLVTGTPSSELAATFLINAFILLYVMLPGVRKAFGQK